MSVYMIIDSKIKDSDKYNEYIEQVSPIVEKYGGRYHVRSENIRSFGTWNPERIIVIEFPSEAHIHQWLASPQNIGRSHRYGKWAQRLRPLSSRVFQTSSRQQVA